MSVPSDKITVKRHTRRRGGKTAKVAQILGLSPLIEVKPFRRRRPDTKSGRPVRVRIGEKYTYRPGALDLSEPHVIRGRPIFPNTIVTVTNFGFDPLHKLAWVRDNEGNEQSGFVAALWRQEDYRP